MVLSGRERGNPKRGLGGRGYMCRFLPSTLSLAARDWAVMLRPLRFTLSSERRRSNIFCLVGAFLLDTGCIGISTCDTGLVTKKRVRSCVVMSPLATHTIRPRRTGARSPCRRAAECARGRRTPPFGRRRSTCFPRWNPASRPSAKRSATATSSTSYRQNVHESVAEQRTGGLCRGGEGGLPV
mgnify:CR=1 FL=1